MAEVAESCALQILCGTGGSPVSAQTVLSSRQCQKREKLGLVKIKSGVRDNFSSSRFSQQLSTSFCLQKGKFDKRSRSRLRSSRGKKESGMLEAPGRAVATAHGGVVSSRSKESFTWRIRVNCDWCQIVQ
jgi:hypothetical protein